MSSTNETLNQPETGDHESGKALMGGIALIIFAGVMICKSAGCNMPGTFAQNMPKPDGSQVKMITMTSAPTVK